MSADALIAEAKQLIAKAENGLKTIENAEPTQLRIVVNRLRLFLEQHGIGADEPVSEPSVEPESFPEPAPEPEPVVEEPEPVAKATPKRRGRPPKATE